MARHDRFIGLAQRLANKNDFPRLGAKAHMYSQPLYRMAAVVVQGARVVSIGVNKWGGGESKNRMYANRAIHGELDAIHGIDPALLRGATIYISGWSKGNNLILSKPCDLCQRLIEQAGIKEIVYHDRDGNVVLEKTIMAESGQRSKASRGLQYA